MPSLTLANQKPPPAPEFTGGPNGPFLDLSPYGPGAVRKATAYQTTPVPAYLEVGVFFGQGDRRTADHVFNVRPFSPGSVKVRVNTKANTSRNAWPTAGWLTPWVTSQSE